MLSSAGNDCAQNRASLVCGEGGSRWPFLQQILLDLNRRGGGATENVTCLTAALAAFSPRRLFPGDEGIVVTRLLSRHPAAPGPNRAATADRLWS
jgi:hypothetical protein